MRAYCLTAIRLARDVSRHVATARLGATTGGHTYGSPGFVPIGLLALRRVTTRRYCAPARLGATTWGRTYSSQCQIVLPRVTHQQPCHNTDPRRAHHTCRIATYTTITNAFKSTSQSRNRYDINAVFARIGILANAG